MTDLAPAEFDFDITPYTNPTSAPNQQMVMPQAEPFTIKQESDPLLYPTPPPTSGPSQQPQLPTLNMMREL